MKTPMQEVYENFNLMSDATEEKMERDKVYITRRRKQHVNIAIECTFGADRIALHMEKNVPTVNG